LLCPSRAHHPVPALRLNPDELRKPASNARKQSGPPRSWTPLAAHHFERGESHPDPDVWRLPSRGSQQLIQGPPEWQALDDLSPYRPRPQKSFGCSLPPWHGRLPLEADETHPTG